MSKSSQKQKRSFPVWIWFYLAFMVLFTAWYFLFKAAYQNQPQTVPLQNATPNLESVKK